MSYDALTLLSHFPTILATKRRQAILFNFVHLRTYPPRKSILTSIAWDRKFYLWTIQKWVLFLQGAHLEMFTFFANVNAHACTWTWTSPGGGVTCCVVYVWHVVHHEMHAICMYPPRVQHLINRSLGTCAHQVRLIMLWACADCRNQQQSRNCSKILYGIQKPEQHSRNCSEILFLVIHKPKQKPRNCGEILSVVIANIITNLGIE